MDFKAVYRIARWNEIFEKADNRRCVTMRWISLPIDFNSSGYESLLNEFEGRAAEVYGCWCALLCLASTCPVRGVLADTKGRPKSVSWMVRTSGFPSELFERLITWAASPSVGWLVSVPADELAVMLREACSALPLSTSSNRTERGRKPAASASRESSGQHPDEMGLHPDKPATHPDESSICPDAIRTTGQDITGHDKTSSIRSITREELQHPDAAGSAIRTGSIQIGSMEDVLRSTFERLRRDPEFCDNVLRLANRLLKLRTAARIPQDKLTKQAIWQIAWTCQHMDLETVQGCIEAIKNHHARDPVKYLMGSMRKLCQKKAHLDWDRVRELVPEPPPAAPPAASTGSATAASATEPAIAGMAS